MTRNKIIANRLQEVLIDGRWIANTNYKEQIERVNWRQATQKIENLNTISSLTFHINYYLRGLLDAFETGKLEIKDQFSFDCPPIQSQEDWNVLVADFLTNAHKFISWVENVKDHELDEPFVDGKYGTLLRNLEGMIEHGYYHLGQISLIKKLIANNEQ